ncbi:MAG: bifunctional UDP-N-acetylmuramoyl-tripeptide:D-alanyl-D-alanine ligase/alanine racemase [Bacteroidales bacterium]|nr:bifunctional UDP-N-acetylmuramoyl-tripeptide:D-alanyl-D-alanine ligase/alanine racemase [Bacteroidales bacterium]
MTWHTNQIAEICNGKVIGNSHYNIQQIITDSRFIHPVLPHQMLFVCIKGKRFDGHAFIDELYQKGVKSFIIEKELKEYKNDALYIKVINSITALQQIASAHRAQFNFPVIAITGSYGKSIVKEWLFDILEEKFSVIRSPKSFNSQLGVPLSVLQMQHTHNLAIFEAGISQPNEMQQLANIIQPTIGIFTNIGKAHQENFETLEQKIFEKLKLFENSSVVIVPSKYTSIIELFKRNYPHKKLITWGNTHNDTFYITNVETDSANTLVKGFYKQNEEFVFRIPFRQEVLIENALTAIVTVLYLNVEKSVISHKAARLKPVDMRLEMVEAINNSTLINDYYNSDLSSISLALQFLEQQNKHSNKAVILSDIPHTGINPSQLYQTVGQWICELKPKVFVGIGTEIEQHKDYFPQHSYYFSTAEDFIHQLYRFDIANSTILLKGARKFEFEKIRYILEKQSHETLVIIDMNALRQNYLTYKSLLPENTGMIVMVKAFSYGSGLLEIARLFQDQNVQYLAVAFADEGIELRTHGIHIPIMVMSPEHYSFNSLIEYHLEPVVYNFYTLRKYAEASKKSGFINLPIHIKIDSGMHRLGFSYQEIDALIDEIKKYSWLKIATVFTHLAAADDEKEDDYTKQQIFIFNNCLEKFRKSFSYSILSHVQNSAGIERFSQYRFDLARLGIGLYGFSRTPELKQKLLPVLTFKTKISQIKSLKKGDTVGYNRKGIMQNDGKIAILPVGYADGLNRRLSNGAFHVKVNHQLAPIIGTICMDMCMIDITHIPNVHEGDEVIIFENTDDIERMANILGTIPYEILTSISRRVKRIYYHE